MLLTKPLRYYLNLQLLPSSLAALQAEASMHAAAATADARPDRLKLVGSAAFQERLAQLKSKGLLLLKPSHELPLPRANSLCDLSIRQHTAYVSIRQHSPAYASIRQNTPAYASIRQHTPAYASRRQHTSEDVSIRQHTSA